MYCFCFYLKSDVPKFVVLMFVSVRSPSTIDDEGYGCYYVCQFCMSDYHPNLLAIAKLW